MVITMHARSHARPRTGRRVAVALLALGLVGLAPAARSEPAAAAAPTTTTIAPGAPTIAPGAPMPLPASPLSPADALKILSATLQVAPPSPPSPDDGFVAVVAADRTVGERSAARVGAAAASEQANQVVVGATSDRDGVTVQVTEAEGKLAAALAKLRVERKRLSGLTVRAYVFGGDDSMERLRAVASGDTSDAAGGRQVVFTQVLSRQRDVTVAVMAKTHEAQVEVRAARQTLREVQARLDHASRVAVDRDTDRRRAENGEQAAVAAAAKARRSLQAQAKQVLPQVPLGVPLVGLARLQPADLAGWFAASPYRPLVATPIADYAQWFIDEGNAEGIRGDIAFAQAVLETGGFTNNDSLHANNLSGIGHCDSCGAGWAFPSPQAGVRAQIQLLKSYAITQPQYVNPIVDSRLRGPAGCCTTWGNLTTVWATDPNYGPLVMAIYTSMVQYAVQRRAAGRGL
jgi:hypothetical protein